MWHGLSIQIIWRVANLNPSSMPNVRHMKAISSRRPARCIVDGTTGVACSRMWGYATYISSRPIVVNSKVSNARCSGGTANTQSGPPLPARVLLTPAYAHDSRESSAISRQHSDVHLLASRRVSVKYPTSPPTLTSYKKTQHINSKCFNGLDRPADPCCVPFRTFPAVLY